MKFGSQHFGPSLFFFFFPFPFNQNLFFQSSFRFTTKLRGKYRDFPQTLLPPLSIPAFAIINIPPPTRVVHTLTITNESPLANHNHPMLTVYITVHSCVVHSTGLDDIMRYIHHYSTIQSIFTALKIFCALLVHPTPVPHSVPPPPQIPCNH